MKSTLVIENEADIPIALKEFLKRNEKHIGTLKVMYNCRNIEPSDRELQDALCTADAICIQSEFLYKDQLEWFVRMFSLCPVKGKYSFFVFNIVDKINSWIDGHNGAKDFHNLPAFLDNFKAIVETQKVYNVDFSYKVKKVQYGPYYL